jgi:hypothetical protein
VTEELRVVFLTPGGLGSGEIVNAVLVAEQLRKKGVDCSFLTFPYGEIFIKPHKFKCIVFKDDKLTNINTMRKYIDQTRPDAVVIADYYLFNTSGVLHKYLWINWMKELDIPVVSFDSLYLGREYPTTAYYIHPELFPQQRYNITYRMPSFVQTLIYPSPPFDSPPPDERDFCGRLYEESFLDYERDPSIREELGVHPDEKLIFHIIPKWETMSVRKASKLDFPAYHPMVAALLTHHLKNLGEKIHVVCVNPSKRQLYTEGDRFRVKEAAFLSFDTYTKYQCSADLIITSNILSATTWKAVLRRVPTLVLGNSFTAKDAASKYDTITENFDVSSAFMELIHDHDKGSSDQLPVLPFWTFFTKHFADMDIGKTFLIAELFDEKGTFETLENILTDEKFKKNLRKKQDEYVEKIARLPTMAELVLSIAQDGSFQKR